MKLKVSVIIPTHRGRDLTKTIDSIKKSTYNNIEIIIVDENKERSEQRNIGIDRAKGDYLLLLDSDQSISPKLIEECVELMNKADAVYIPEVIVADGIFAIIRRWEREFYNGTVVDVVRFVRAKGCPKFDLTMSGPEDSDWDRRVPGKRVISINHLFHDDSITPYDYFNKKVYYTKSMKKFAAKNPNDKCLNFWYRCFWVFLEKGKWLKVVRRPHLFICVMGIILIRGIIYNVNR